jgi:uncharacterized protein YndB with AHSA1/START domain
MNFEASTTINARPADVWHVLTDVVQWPGWLPTVISVEALDGVRLQEGARYKVIQPRVPVAVWTVTRIAPTDGFTWQAASPGLVVVADHVLRVQPGGGTKVKLRVSFDGFLGGVIARISRATTERYLAQKAESLKRTVERAVQPASELLAMAK